MVATVRRLEMDDHTADYWARQIRIGAAVAAVVTAIGGVRVIMAWPETARWWMIVVALAVVAQAAAIRLPWERLVLRPSFRRRLLLWWYAAMPIVALFGLADPHGAML